MSKRKPNPFVERAVAIAGSNAELANRISVHESAITLWKNGYRAVPAKHCIPIERATNGVITRHDLRADVFGQQSEVS